MNRLQEWLAGAAATLGPWGIFLVALSDSAFIPMPQGVDALLIAQAIASPSTAYLAAGLAVVGSIIGSLILYSIARRGGRMLLEKKASSGGIARMQRLIEKYDALVLLLPAMIPLPLPMKLFVIAAGVFQMKIARFVAVIAFARVVRYFGEVFLALRYGEQTTAFLKENTLLGVGIAVAIIAVFLVVHRWSTRSVNQE